MHGKEATQTPTPTGSTPKTKCPPPFRLGGHNDPVPPAKTQISLGNDDEMPEYLINMCRFIHQT